MLAYLLVNGAFNAPQLAECTTNLVRGTDGNPSVVGAARGEPAAASGRAQGVCSHAARRRRGATERR